VSGKRLKIMTKLTVVFAIFDSRYLNSPERSIVFEFCDTLREANKTKKDYGDGNIVVKQTIKNGIVIKSDIV
jgi:hypothetical protein